MSSSKSSSSTTTSTQQTDRRIGATDQAVVLNLEQGASLEVTDPGAVNATVETAQQAFDAFDQLINEAFAFADEQTARGFKIAEAGLAQARSESERTVSRLLTVGAVVAVVAVGAQALPKILK